MIQTFVYFLRPIGMDGPVKIGHSEAPKQRLRTYNAAAPWRLEIVATLPGPQELEARFHAHFIAQHSYREWFFASPELSRIIDEIRAGTFDPAILPTKGCRPEVPPRKRWTPEMCRAQSYSQRLYRMRRRGVSVPQSIWEAERRFSRSWSVDQAPYSDGDAAIIDAFLAEHWRPAQRQRAA